MTSMTYVLGDTLAKDANGPEFGKASPLGLLLVLILLVATMFLMRSMNKHLRRVPTSFSRDSSEIDRAADEDTESAGVPLDRDETPPGRENG